MGKWYSCLSPDSGGGFCLYYFTCWSLSLLDCFKDRVLVLMYYVALIARMLGTCNPPASVPQVLSPGIKVMLHHT